MKFEITGLGKWDVNNSVDYTITNGIVIKAVEFNSIDELAKAYFNNYEIHEEHTNNLNYEGYKVYTITETDGRSISEKFDMNSTIDDDNIIFVRVKI